MTLCIAAKCRAQVGSAIVMASDWRIEDTISGSETASKQSEIVPGWHVMYAGSQARAMQLMSSVRIHLLENPLRPGTVLSTLTEVVKSHRALLIDEFIYSQVGRSYTWLLDEGHAVLPNDYYSELVRSVCNVRLEAQLILCGFIEQFPVIAQIDESRGEPSVRMAENFASIGSGAIIAESMLHRREYQEDFPLKLGMYCINEAKLMGEASPGVGAATTLSVIFSDGREAGASEQFREFFENCFDKYGPKPIGGFGEWGTMGSEFLNFLQQGRRRLASTIDASPLTSAPPEEPPR